MAITPEFDAFAQGYAKGENQVIYTRLAADLDTPVSLMLKLGSAQKDSFMLESVTGGEVRGRYSIVGIKPDLIWKCVGTTSSINRSARYDEDAFAAQSGKPLDEFRALLAESHIDLPAELPQSAAGLFGYLGYDMVRHIEHLPNINPDPIGVPDALFLRPSVVAVLDGAKGEVILVSPVWHSDDASARAAYAQAAERVMDAVRDLERPVTDPRDLGAANEVPEPTSNFTHQGFLDAVAKAKDYIAAGDIFQVVLSQRWTQEFKLPPFSLYRSLRRTNPSPFMFYFNFGTFQVIGASPEILVRVFGNQVTVRP
ncbi:MAG: anthranilate synthase component I, partial [Rhodobacteraceae bacterium]|nr:anthranilate synthase component I [Paracoccaceae bacterium]